MWVRLACALPFLRWHSIGQLRPSALPQLGRDVFGRGQPELIGVEATTAHEVEAIEFLATTHWAHARDLQKRYPAIKVEEDRIFITDGPVWTSAGMSAGIDLALSMIEKDLGAELARVVSKALVLHHRRAGGQSQHSALLELDAKSDRIQSALQYAKRNLHTPLSVEQLADAAHLSPRQFSRAFHAETGQSPAKAVENLRVEAARVMMEQGGHSIDVVANETGFADRERMRRAFLRAYGQPPQTMRRNARVERPARAAA